jgi:Ca-activated chloride channel family protein
MKNYSFQTMPSSFILNDSLNYLYLSKAPLLQHIQSKRGFTMKDSRLFKRSVLFIAIATLTACSQYEVNTKAENDPNNKPIKDKVELEKVVTSDAQISVSEEAYDLAAASPKKERFVSSLAYTHGSAIPYPPPAIENRETYNPFDDNGVKLVSNDPVSTFSIDVDTGSYSNMRRMLNQGIIPPQDSIRVEEMINYFNYNYPNPDNTNQPFSISTELAPTPWNSNSQLLHVGIQGYEIENSQRPASNLTFLVDVSGSMNSPDKLGLLKSSFKLMTKNLRKQDKVAIVVYAGAAGAVLDSTSGDKKSKILQALDKLTAGGSTNGAAGIELAYQISEENFIKDGINRVIIATDGDFNVGTTNFEQLTELVSRKKENGISLTTLGFGNGNYNDHLMEQLANKGNGNYAYIDTLKEANKVLVNEISSTLMTIAKDVKIQIEFNPLVVSQYRLIGYENRVLNNEDFNNDKIDAGEIGSGHNVTAMYEVVLTGDKGWVEPLKYQSNNEHKPYSNELATLKVRYKQPNEDKSQLIVNTINKSQIIKNLNQASDNFKLSTSVAGFGQLLRGGKMIQQFSYKDVKNLAQQTMAKDQYGYRGEFLQLVSLAESLSNTQVNNVE